MLAKETGFPEVMTMPFEKYLAGMKSNSMAYSRLSEKAHRWLRARLKELGGPVVVFLVCYTEDPQLKSRVGSPRIFKVEFHEQTLSSLGWVPCTQ